MTKRRGGTGHRGASPARDEEGGEGVRGGRGSSRGGRGSSAAVEGPPAEWFAPEPPASASSRERRIASSRSIAASASASPSLVRLRLLSEGLLGLKGVSPVFPAVAPDAAACCCSDMAMA